MEGRDNNLSTSPPRHLYKHLTLSIVINLHTTTLKFLIRLFFLLHHVVHFIYNLNSVSEADLLLQIRIYKQCTSRMKGKRTVKGIQINA